VAFFLDPRFKTDHIPKPNPLYDWWRSQHNSYPILVELAKKYLCVCASSVASERLFI